MTKTFRSEIEARKFMATLASGSYTYWHAGVAEHVVTIK